MADTTITTPNYQQVISAWNAQADEHNQWDELGEDEKIEWAVKCAADRQFSGVSPCFCYFFHQHRSCRFRAGHYGLPVEVEIHRPGIIDVFADFNNFRVQQS